MKAGSAGAFTRRIGIAPLGLLAIVLGLLAIENTAGFVVGLSVAAAGLAISATWRAVGWPIRVGVEVAPVAVALIYLTLTAPPTVISEILAGLAGAMTLVWIADVSARPVGRVGRVLDQLVMPLAGFAIALGISFVYPIGPLSLGLASLLLVLVVVFAVLILARPAIVGRREAPTS